MDFGAPHETALTKLNDKPVFVYGYPSSVKAFYMEPWPGRPEVCKSVDLLAPEGYGEICGGSERMSRSRPAAGPHPEGGTARGSLQVVPGAAQVWLGPAFGIRHGRGASHRLDLRHRAHPRGDPLPEDDQAGISVKPSFIRSNLPVSSRLGRSCLCQGMITFTKSSPCVRCPGAFSSAALISDERKSYDSPTIRRSRYNLRSIH